MNIPKASKSVEQTILNYFSKCPLCKETGSMTFEWGHVVPTRMACSSCNASWQPLLGFDKDVWSLVGVKLLSKGSQTVDSELLHRTFDGEFWKRMALEQEKKRLQDASQGVEKVVILREVVKIRCRYCGSLYDETKDRCPYCSGTR